MATKGFTKSKPSFESAARGNYLDRLQMDKNFHGRLAVIEKKLNVGTGNSDNKTPVASTPVQAQLSVVAPVAGFISVAIKNPEYIVTGPNKVKGNEARAPIIHQVRYSPNANFIGSVTTLDPSTQNHYLLPTGGKAQYVELKSSHDGVNYNSAQTSGAVGS